MINTSLDLVPISILVEKNIHVCFKLTTIWDQFNHLSDESASGQGGRSTVPKYNSAEKGRKISNAFSKEREVTDASYQRKSRQFRRQNVCNCKLNNYFGAKTS